MNKSSNLLEKTAIRLSPSQVDLADMSLNVVLARGIFSKKYFLEYEASEESLVLTQSLLAGVKDAFKGDEKVAVSTDKENIYVDGKSEQYKEPLLNGEYSEPTLKMIETDNGIIPEKMDATVDVFLDVAELTSLPDSKTYEFISTEKDMKVILRDAGVYTKTLTLKRPVRLAPLNIIFDGSYLQHLLNNLTGEFELLLREGAAMLVENSKDHKLTYLLAANEA